MRFHFLFWVLLLPACVAPPDFGAPSAGCEREGFQGVFVLNEGVWTQNNASLDFLLEEGETCEGVFSQANGQPLGDTGHSIFLDQDTLFVVINQSRRVYKLQMPAMEMIGELSLPAGASPREMARISPRKAYLTSLTDNSLYRFDPVSMTLTGDPVWVENYMEDIEVVGEMAFVSCGNYAFPASNNKLAIIDLGSDTVVEYLELPVENPGRILRDGKKLYVLCRGDYDPAAGGSALVEVSSEGRSISRTLSFPGASYEMELVPGAILVLGDSGISRVSLEEWVQESNYLPKSALTDSPFDLLYELAYDPAAGMLYVSNARYGGIGGEVLRLDPFLNILQRWEVGLYPGEVFFYR